MITLKKSLTQCLLDAYYTFMAENNLSRFDCVIDVSYLEPELQHLLVTHPSYDAKTTQIVLNLSMNALRYIDYNGDQFHAEMSLRGVPTKLTIPFHAFVAINIPITENSGTTEYFPSYDRVVYERNNNIERPESSEQVQYQITPNSLIQELHRQGRLDANFSNYMQIAKDLWTHSIPDDALERMAEATRLQMAQLDTRAAEVFGTAPAVGELGGLEPVSNVVELNADQLEDDDEIPWLDSTPEPTPALVDLMRGRGRTQDDMIKEMMEFPGHSELAGLVRQQPKSKYKGKPILTVIRGGKQ